MTIDPTTRARLSTSLEIIRGIRRSFNGALTHAQCRADKERSLSGLASILGGGWRDFTLTCGRAIEYLDDQEQRLLQTLQGEATDDAHQPAPPPIHVLLKRPDAAPVTLVAPNPLANLNARIERFLAEESTTSN